MEAELSGMRAEINGLVDKLEGQTDIKPSRGVLKTLQLYQRGFVESADEWRTSDTEDELHAMYCENLRSAHKRYVRLLMSTLKIPLPEEAVYLRV
jgi:hypothetical protein